LQVSEASITSDIQYLRNQAIKEYVTEHLPEQYQVCLVALDSIIKRAFDILFKDTHLIKLELLSNATTIDSALNYIRSKQQQQQQEEEQRQSKSKKHLSLDSTNGDDGDDNIDDSGSGSRSDSQLTKEGRQTVF
jgi:hypothetical protein